MCGIFALVGMQPDPTALMEALALLRHRGQDGFGFWLAGTGEDQKRCLYYRDVESSNGEILRGCLDGNSMTLLAHWRYATRGDAEIANTHPITIDNATVAIVYNGQFDFPADDWTSSKSDARTFAEIVGASPHTGLLARLAAATSSVRGAYSLVAATTGRLVTLRDRFGIRPMYYAALDDCVAIASEVPPLERLGASQIKEVAAGTTIEWSARGPEKAILPSHAEPAPCAFEYVYFHSPAGILDSQPVAVVRFRIGQRLAQEAPAESDFVVPVPRSGVSFADGFSSISGIPVMPAICLSGKARRTFIAGKAARAQELVQKYVFDREALRNRSVTLVDDSLVRGTTLRFLVRELRESGVREIHVRIGSPTFRHPCFFGIDIPDRHELAAAQCGTAELRRALGLDSLSFISVAGLQQAIGRNSLCLGCFTGRYPRGALWGKRFRRNVSRQTPAASHELPDVRTLLPSWRGL